MMIDLLWQKIVCLSTLLVITCLVGCQPDPVVVKQEGDGYANLMEIESAYRQYTADKQKPPTSDEDLLAFGATPEMLISDRDGKPFKIYWGVAMNEANGPPIIVAHEVDGKDGKRLALSTFGVMMMTEEEFAAASFPSSD